MNKTAEKIMITGATGFAGRYHVAEAGRRYDEHDNPYGLIVIGRRRDQLAQLNAEFPTIQPANIDLATEPVATEMLLQKYKPKFIVHLAAYPSPTTVEGQDVTIQNNNVATKNLLEAVKKHSPDSTVIITTSSVVYGAREGKLQENDELPEEINDVYTKSKRRDIELIEAYKEKGLNIVEARVFNHTGPGHEKGLYAKTIGEVFEASKTEKSVKRSVDNLLYARDLSDVRDWAAASLHLAENVSDGTYNICSGRSITLEEFLKTLQTVLGVDIEIEDREKPIVPLNNFGDNTLLKSTGWTQRRTLEQTVADFVKHAEKVKLHQS